MDAGLLLLRVILAAVLTTHALQKLLGWFRGPGRDGAAAIMRQLGLEPARVLAMVAVTCELVSGSLLLLGLATPAGAAIAAGAMLVASSSVTGLAGTVWNAHGGGEYPLVLAGAAIVLGFTGPGRASLDHALALPWSDWTVGGSAVTGSAMAVVAGLAAAVPALQVRRRRAEQGAADDVPPAPSRHTMKETR